MLGALALAFGQLLVNRRDRVDSYRDDILLLCAQVAALSWDFRNRVWEERTGVASDVVEKWDVHGFQLAEAQLAILNPNAELRERLQHLRESGQELGLAWRTAEPDEEIEELWRSHRSALARFVEESASLARRYRRR